MSSKPTPFRRSLLADYVAAAVMDMSLASVSLGLTLLGAVPNSPFNVPDFNFRFAMLMAVSGLGTAIGSIYLSRLSDRFGRKPIILISTAGLVVTCLLFVVSYHWWHLYAISICRSAFMGMFWPGLEARITDGVAGREMTRRLGWFGIFFCTGLLLGYPVSGGLHDAAPGTPFYAGAAFAVVLLVLLGWTFRRDRSHDGHRPDGPDANGDDADPLPPAPVRRAFLLAAWISNALSYAGAGVLRSLFPRFANLPVAEGGLGLTGFDTGVIAAATSAAMLIAFVVLGKYHFWHFRYRYLVLGQFGMLLGSLAFVFGSTMPVLVAGSLAFGFATGVIYIASIYYSLEGHAMRAGQSGLHEGILCFGWSGGMFIVAAISRYAPGHRTPLVVCSVILAAGIVLLAAVYVRGTLRAGGADEPGTA